MELDNDVIESFQKKIFEWWEKNKRDLPWRKTTNPYFIMVSEIMLQQTQVSRTIKKYLKFIERFPTLKSLAEAKPADVLKMWSGLGYNRRALWLHQAAKQLVNEKKFPEKPEELQKLKGIGPYTARSILIFAMNKDYPTVDTNIRRILISEGFAKELNSEKELFLIAEKLLPKGKSRDWHNALMDYGSQVVTAAKTGIKPTTKQSNSTKITRQYRGAIVKRLAEKQKLTKKQLQNQCKIDPEKITDILESLQKDGLIVKTANYYHLPLK